MKASCDVQASERKIYGAAKTSFTNKCVKNSVWNLKAGDMTRFSKPVTDIRSWPFSCRNMACLNYMKVGKRMPLNHASDGVYAIAPTPFHADGRIDEVSLDRMTDF